MPLYSLKMRASKSAEHISGAEKILNEKELDTNIMALVQRALHHTKGQPDLINIKIETVDAQKIEYIDALPVSSIDVDSPAQGQNILLEYLKKLGLRNSSSIIKKFKETYAMRGAMLLNADTLERLEPNLDRGIRATYMDAEHTALTDNGCCKNHFQEAVILASKVANAPNIIAEICISDDPDYVTGYIASKKFGYVRITKLKKDGCPYGGRIFLYRGRSGDKYECIDYLEKQHVLVRSVPSAPAKKIKEADPWQFVRDDLQERKESFIYREMKEMHSAQCSHVYSNGRDLLMLASNNYLNLSNDPRTKRAAQKATEQFGTGSGGSRLLTGTLPLHTVLEKNIANYKNTEAALLYNTGYMANVGIITALCDKNSVIFSDEYNHASIIDGCRLSRARTVIYRHNDMTDLADKIRKTPCSRGLIVTDAVFSMDGDIAFLPDILETAKKNHLLCMVDEAHSTGVIGKTGHGICEYFGLTAQPDIIMGTMSKALGSEGGYVCGSRLLIDELCNKSRSFIFSTSLSPAVIAAADEALRILAAEPQHVKQLQNNVQYFCDCLKKNGIYSHSDSAIVPINIGDEKQSMQIAQKLFEHNIFILAIRYPTVKKGKALLRAAIMATHTEQELHHAADIIARYVDEK
ncbi:8-amino-7-oxononanoate synthase [Pectinatus haikarae]|nr:8-amino-7-oxononanoate synthase [Pectinatus haikarae]